jgi:signal transduction histidine kinase
VLSIQDTGPGIPSDAGKPMSVALEGKSKTPRTEEAAGADTGEGIGLSIVKRLCDMLDASIELKSVEGVGTTFKILFPRHYS